MFETLYDKLNGFHPGGLYCIASSPCVGKTSLMLNIALDYAKKLNKKVLIFSLEMSKSEMGNRLYSIVGGDESTIKLPIYIDDESIVTSYYVKQAIDGKKPGIVFIDYLQLMSSYTRGSGGNNLIYTLKCIAEAANIPIVILCQMNRKLGRPELVDFRLSLISDQSFDGVLFLYKPEILEIIVAKNRYGDTFTLNATCSNWPELRYTECSES